MPMRWSAKLQAAGFRVEADTRNEKINYKVREHSLAKVPLLLVVGKREAEEGTVAVRRLGSEERQQVHEPRRGDGDAQGRGDPAGPPVTIRRGTPADVARAVDIWRTAVDATHRFLTAEDRAEIDVMVATEFLPNVELWLAVDGEDRAVGFLVLDGDMIDALFVDPAAHGQGYGTELLNHAIALGATRVEASEQATNALPFYLARGFTVAGRSETDPQGRPYPLIELHLAAGDRSRSRPGTTVSK